MFTQCDPARCVIAIATSVGGMPADFPAPIAIVMHLSPDHKYMLAEFLNRRTHLEIKEATSVRTWSTCRM